MYEAFPFQSIFESIKKEPFKIPEDDGNDLNNTFFNPDKEGWLWKQGIAMIQCIYAYFTSSLSEACKLTICRVVRQYFENRSYCFNC